MQGHRSSSLTTLPENLSFDHGSTDASIDSQLPWNTVHPSAPNRLPSNDTNAQFFSHLRHNGHSQWNLGGSSASQNHAYGNEGKTEPHARGLHSPLENNNAVNLNMPHTTNGSFLLQNPTSEAISQDLNMSSTFDENVDNDCQTHARGLHSPLENNNAVNLNMPHTTNGSFLLQNPTSEAISQDLNMSSTFDENDDDDCQIVEHPNTYISSNDDTSRRISCKRKVLEVQVGQSSASASSSSFQNVERSQIHYQPIVLNNMMTPSQTQTELANSRLRLGVGGSSFSSENPENSGRNLRVRINSLPHQEAPLAANPFLGEAEMGNRDVSSSSSRYSGRLLRNQMLDVNPVPSMEHLIPPDHFTPPLRRNSQTRWSRGSSSRTSRASVPIIPEPALTNAPIPRTISEHPIFIPPPSNEMGSSSQHHTSWNLVGDGTSGNIGNAVSASGTGSSSRPGSGSVGNISAADWARRYRQNYPRRLSEIARRSQLSAAGTEAGLGGTNHGTGSGSSLTPQEMALLSGSHSHDRHAPSARAALLERNIDGALGLPYSLRTFAAGSEGRSSVMSEIRHVLNLMRRGEGLRIEDVMLLDHSVFFGMADIHDRHRDMRLDVDNMSYEELLALEERIGNVSTGLSEDSIMKGLKQHKYYLDNNVSTRDQVETEPCSICREEYNDGEDLGRLECGHDFHRDCIKQWLVQKNSCPICKKAGLST